MNIAIRQVACNLSVNVFIKLYIYLFNICHLAFTGIVSGLGGLLLHCTERLTEEVLNIIVGVSNIQAEVAEELTERCTEFLPCRTVVKTVTGFFSEPFFNCFEVLIFFSFENAVLSIYYC